MWLPRVDGVVAGLADDKGLPPPLCQMFRPRGSWLPQLAEVGELADLVHVHLARVPADLAPVRQEPGDLWRMMPGTGARLEMTASCCLLSGMPPNHATSGFPPPRSILASRHLPGPCGVAIVALYLRAIFVTDDSCLAASVLSISCWASQRSPVLRAPDPINEGTPAHPAGRQPGPEPGNQRLRRRSSCQLRHRTSWLSPQKGAAPAAPAPRRLGLGAGRHRDGPAHGGARQQQGKSINLVWSSRELNYIYPRAARNLG